MLTNRFSGAVILLLLGLFLVAGPGPAWATRISESVYTCDFCGQKFTDKMLWSTNVMERDSEFRPLAMGIDPLPYYVHSCPHCGFTNNREGQITDQEKAEIGKFLAAYRQSHGGQISPAGKYEVLARTYIIRKFPSEKIAYAFQQAAWLADDSHNDAEGRKFRTASLEYLIKALENREVEAKKVPILTYLAGEVNRRLGRFDEALQWFSRVQADEPGFRDLVAQQAKLAKKKDDRPDRRLDLR